MNARSFLCFYPLTTTLILLAAAATAPAAAAGPALDPVLARHSLSVSCASPQVPGFIEIGRTFGIDDGRTAFTLRNQVRRSVIRACNGGADRVLVVMGPTRSGESQLLAISN